MTSRPVLRLPLHTSRLILRPFASSDAETFARYRSDPDVARYQGWDTPFTLQQAGLFIAAMQETQPGLPGRWYQIAIEQKRDGSLIGDCAFLILAEDPRQAEIGFSIARAYQGQGIATEAVTCLLGCLFDFYDLHRVRANCDPENTGSMKVLTKVGMRHEGRFVDSLWFKGRWASEDWFAVLREEWDQRIRANDSCEDREGK